MSSATTATPPSSTSAEPLPKQGAAITKVATATAPLAPKTLDKNEIARRLAGLPNSVAEQVFKIVEAQVAAETGRQQRIDAKATSLLAAVALSLTVAFSFGAVLLKDGWGYWKDKGMHAAVVVCFAATLLCGFVAAVYALRALLVKPYPGMNEEAVFSVDIFKRVEEVAAALDDAPGDTAAAKTAAAEASALAQYRMSMTIQMWRMVQDTRANHATKSKRVARGQYALIAFLVAVGSLFLLIGYAAYFVQTDAGTQNSSTASPAPGPGSH